MKYLIPVIFLLFSNTLHSETLRIDYWNGLVYDFSNATAYEIKQPIPNNFEVGIIAVTSQLYWTCDGCYVIIPQKYAAKVSKTFTINNLAIDVSANYWSNKSIIFPSKYNFELGFNYQLKDYTQINFKHYSNPNTIHNLYNISFEHRF